MTDYKVFGLTLSCCHFCKILINSVVVTLEINSKYTGLLHDNKSIHALDSALDFYLPKLRPASSMPTTCKGKHSFLRSLGSGSSLGPG